MFRGAGGERATPVVAGGDVAQPPSDVTGSPHLSTTHRRIVGRRVSREDNRRTPGSSCAAINICSSKVSFSGRR
ncbi:hypothetical protein C0Q70_04777 [Pomacea canaliculata]|uniref:Uncharacterized protein n=1 Tax=Pomacea canaliculata TaxID=400727 RepID=A0A2T7PJB6_POMCA|nr:hypothetical protein C0Q70_04777 [Pomacea canaliculata]